MEFVAVSDTGHYKRTAQYHSDWRGKHAPMWIQTHAFKTGAERFSERGKFDYMRCAKHAVVAYVKTALFSKVKDGLPFVPKYVYAPVQCSAGSNAHAGWTPLLSRDFFITLIYPLPRPPFLHKYI